MNELPHIGMLLPNVGSTVIAFLTEIDTEMVEDEVASP